MNSPFPSVTGIDLSLTSTGVCTVTPAGNIVLDLVTSKGHKNDPWYARIARLDAIVEGILAMVPERSYVILEGPSYGSAGASSSLWDRAGLWHRLAGALVAAGHHVAVAQPATVKKWATGSGTADKAAVASAITRLMPDVELRTSDAADSLALALMGGHHLGWHEYSKARTACLKSVSWPEEVLGELSAA